MVSLVKTPRSRGTFRISNLPNRNIPVSPKMACGCNNVTRGFNSMRMEFWRGTVDQSRRGPLRSFTASPSQVVASPPRDTHAAI